jgi:osmotically-inducible protein OsmY
MRKYGKWVLVLGVMSACPTVASADGFLSRLKPRLPFSEASDQERNQQQANDVIGAMRKAQVQGEGIQVQVIDGVAVITGSVSDPAQRTLAQRAAGTVPGITRVQNDIKYVPPGGGQVQPAAAATEQPKPTSVTRAAAVSTGAPARQIQQVAASTPPAPATSQPAAPPAKAAAPKASNDTAVARGVAQSLADAGLLNYDIEVRCTNGVATLIGQVDSPAQRQSAAQAASRVPGVTTVHNGLTVARPVAQVSAPAANRPAVQAPPMQAAPMPMQAAAMPMQMPMQAGQAMMPPTAVGYAPTSYNHPHLPPYAWPS